MEEGMSPDLLTICPSLQHSLCPSTEAPSLKGSKGNG